MSILIEVTHIAGNKTLVPHDAGLSHVSAIQIGMAVHSTVDQSNANATAGVPGLPRRESVYRRRCIAQGPAVTAIQADVYDVRLVREADNAVAVQHRDQAVDQRQASQDLASQLQDVVYQTTQQAKQSTAIHLGSRSVLHNDLSLLVCGQVL